MQALRDEYCNNTYSSSSSQRGCGNTVRALLGRTSAQAGLRLRCYSDGTLKSVSYNSGYDYDASKPDNCIHSNTSSLLELYV